AELALPVEDRRERMELPALVPEPEQKHEPFPLTQIQQAYWVGRDASFELGSVPAHVYLEFEGRGVDLDRVGHTLRKLIDRHDMLRAIVAPPGEQRILPEV